MCSGRSRKQFKMHIEEAAPGPKNGKLQKVKTIYYINHTTILQICFVSAYVAKGSRFTSFYILGPGGGDVFSGPCFGCPQPFATVRDRPRAAIVAGKLPYLWGKVQKYVFFKVSEEVLVSFFVAGVAFCDISCVSEGMCLRGRCGRQVAVSMGQRGEHFSVCTFHTQHSILIPLHFTLHNQHSTITTKHKKK